MVNNGKRINLDGEWQLYGFPFGQYVIDHPDDLTSLNLSPIKAQVPGNVELDLLNAGLIPEPFFGKNFQDLRAFETYEWWYIRKFGFKSEAGSDKFQLEMRGVDTYGTVWINGVLIGNTHNMLIEHRLQVDNLLEGENQIVIRIKSAVNESRKHHYDPSMMSWENREEGLFTRKAPHGWGWDIMPRIVSAGIWRSIWIESIPKIDIDQLYFWTADISSTSASVGVWFQFHTPDTDLSGYSLDIFGICGDHKFEHHLPVEFITGRGFIQVKNPFLWWPKGYGEPNLYEVRVQLKRNGETLCERNETIGIRKATILRSESVKAAWQLKGPDGIPSRVDINPDPDSHFLVKINDVPIMIKGTNWVPLDAYHSRDNERLSKALDLADELHCNMIRCWGGNVYEDHGFFDYCDQHGILVWQDFSFACCRYPQTPEFLDLVRIEAEVVVRKLRNHSSLIIWCGDNEIDMTYLSDGLSPENNRISREVLPQIIHRLDPHREYIPSSPYISPEAFRVENPWTATPEQHLWGPRGYYKSRFYSDHSAHFIGEIGYHGCPNVRSIKKFISPEKLWPITDSTAYHLIGNDEWQAHAVYHWQHDGVDRDRIQLMSNQIRELFGEIPNNMDDYVLASQICQAEAIKYFIESTRLRKWHTSGILWWNLIDGWPQFSDAIVDYYYSKKLAYYYVKRVQQPVSIILGEPGGDSYLPIIMCNDSSRYAEGSYRIWDGDSGEVVAEDSFQSPTNQNWQLGRIRSFTSEHRLYLIEWIENGKSFGNHYMVGSPPINLQRYRDWLPAIAKLSNSFDIRRIIGD
jgi:beta-mannosidase